MQAELDDLYVEAQSYIGKTFAESTKASYRAHLRAYLRFCIYFRLPPIPASQRTIMCYITFLARTLKPSSITSYINIIRILHLEAHLENPLEHNFMVNNLKKGIRRELGTPPKQKLPITCEILVDIFQKLNFHRNKDVAFWCACLLGFFGFLRKATLLPKNQNLPAVDCILRKDLRMIGRDHLELHVRKTKTIQFGQRILIIPFYPVPGSVLCPVLAVKSLFRRTPFQPELPLFSYRENRCTKWYTHATFTSQLKAILSSLGFDAKEFSCHSFRRGGASYAFGQDMSIIDIKQRGDWSSEAVERYIHIDKRQLNNVAKKLAWGARGVK